MDRLSGNEGYSCVTSKLGVINRLRSRNPVDFLPWASSVCDFGASVGQALSVM